MMQRRTGGIEPLRVSTPRELKSRPSTSPSHPGFRKTNSGTRHLNKDMLVAEGFEGRQSETNTKNVCCLVRCLFSLVGRAPAQ